MSDTLNSEEILKQYRSQLLERTKYVNFRGIPLPKDRDGLPIVLDMPLEKVYIKLHLVEKRNTPDNSQEDVDAHQAVEEYSNHLIDSSDGKTSSQPINLLSLADRLDKLLILGGPGSGKSTALRYIARRKAGNPNNPIPILVRLGEYASALSQDQTLSLVEFALLMASQTDSKFYSVLADSIKANNVIWLLDGLDETQNWEGFIARQIQLLTGKIILTSRPVGHSIDELVGLPRFNIIPITEQNIFKFTQDWFSLIAERRKADSRWITERITWLQQQLDSQPRIKQLISNPLLLTFLIILAGEEPRKELPSHRTELYRRYVEELLESWELNRRSEMGNSLRIGTLEGEDAHKELLKGIYLLGWKLHLLYYGGKSEPDPTRDELSKYLAQNHENWGQNAILNSSGILDFWIKAGLLETWYYKDKEFIAFRHFTFQEFAAGWGLARTWEQSRKRAWNFLRLRLHHPAWREPILMMSTMLSEELFDPLANDLLSGNSHLEKFLSRDLRLVGALVVERIRAKMGVHPKTMRRILSSLKTLLLKPYVSPEEITDIFEKLVPFTNNILIESLNTKYRTTFDAVLCAVSRTFKGDAIPLIIRYRDNAIDKDGFTTELGYGTLNATIHAMGETGEPIAASYLMQWGYMDSGMGAAIMDSLAKIGDPSALPYLFVAATGGARRAPAALRAIAQFESSQLIQFLESASEVEFGSAIKRVQKIIDFRQDLNKLNTVMADWQGDSRLPTEAERIIPKLLDEYGNEFISQLFMEEIHNALLLIPLPQLKPYLRNYFKNKSANENLVLMLLAELRSSDSIDLVEELIASKGDQASFMASDVLIMLKNSSGTTEKTNGLLEDLLKYPIRYMDVERIQELDFNNDPRINEYMIKALNGSEISKSEEPIGVYLIKEKAFEYLSNRGVMQVLPNVIELIRTNEIRAWAKGIVGFVSKLSDISEIEKILRVLVKKYSIDTVFYVSLRNPDRPLADFLRDLFVLLTSSANAEEFQQMWKGLKVSKSGLVTQEYVEEFDAIETILRRYEHLILRSQTIPDPLHSNRGARNQATKRRRIRRAVISAIAIILVALLPSLFAVSLPLILRLVFALLVGFIVFLAQYSSMPADD